MVPDMASLESWGTKALVRFRLSPFFLLLIFALPAVAQSGRQEIAELLRQAQAATAKGDFSRAAQIFEQARQLSPESVEVNRGLVLSYLEAGRLADAERIAQTAVARWPQDVQLQHWLGLVYFKQGRYENALQTLRRAENLDSGRSD